MKLVIEYSINESSGPLQRLLTISLVLSMIQNKQFTNQAVKGEWEVNCGKLLDNETGNR